MQIFAWEYLTSGGGRALGAVSGPSGGICREISCAADSLLGPWRAAINDTRAGGAADCRVAAAPSDKDTGTNDTVAAMAIRNGNAISIHPPAQRRTSRGTTFCDRRFADFQAASPILEGWQVPGRELFGKWQIFN